MRSGELANPFLGGDSAVRSLNRARIQALPGAQISDDILGLNGYQLLSSETLRRDIAAAAEQLELDPGRPDLVRAFDRCFDDPRARPSALEIAGSYGRRLGCFLLMLARGDPENRAARPEWSEAHWAFWARIEKVYVGGGIISGQMGVHAVTTARELLACEQSCLELERSPYGAYLALIGLARSAPPDVTHMLALDFGQTSVKRGLATYEDEALARLDVWPSAGTVCKEIYTTDYTVEQVRERWVEMLGIIRQAWSRVPPADRPTTGVAMSIASYLLNGHPSPLDRGCYGCLQLLAPHLDTFMRQELSAHLRPGIPLVLEHDGAAAAAVYAGSPHTLVLALGTAIGNGFPPAAGGICRLAPAFSLCILS